MSKLRFLSTSQLMELGAYMNPVQDMILDVLDSDRPNGEAIRDAMRFSLEFAYARIGFEFDMADTRLALEDIARNYMGCKETWKSIIRIAEKGKWAELAETAADYVVGDIKESVFAEAIQQAFQAEVKE
jgi:hypothetical protein